jgi:hypothetical protein
VERIALGYEPGQPLPPDFKRWVEFFSKKAMQEALDGAIDER